MRCAMRVGRCACLTYSLVCAAEKNLARSWALAFHPDNFQGAASRAVVHKSVGYFGITYKSIIVARAYFHPDNFQSVRLHPPLILSDLE